MKEEIKQLAAKALAKANKENVKKYIEIAESHALRAMDIIHAFKVFTEGQVSEEIFANRLANVLPPKATKAIKHTCPQCHKTFWSNQPQAIYCSRACTKAASVRRLLLRKKMEKYANGIHDS